MSTADSGGQGAEPRAVLSDTPDFAETQMATPSTPEVFESPVERRLVLERLNARLFGADEERVAPKIGRYAVLRKLGQGGMGTVYLGYDEQLGRKAAIKLLRTNQSSELGRDRMAREAKALARLSHPNVVPIYESGEHEDDLYIAMEYVEGQTLGEWLLEPRTREQILELFIAAGRGLVAAHEAKLIHRDFKPDNVMIGASGQVKVMDFGLARRVERAGSRSNHGQVQDPFASNWEPPSWHSRSLTQTGAMMGTPAYMAPEQLVGEPADARCDQFSFCVALWEALCGQRPFSGDTIGSLRANVLSGRVLDPPRDSELPHWLRTILERGLAVDVAARWPSMAELIDALEAGPPRRGRVLLSLAAGLALLGGLGLGLSRLPDAAPSCTGLDTELLAVWNEETRSQVGVAISNTGLSYAGETRARVEAGLEAYAQRWLDQRRASCEASARGAQSPERLDRRMTCLDAQLRELEALLEVLARADPKLVEKAVGVVDKLPRPERCADPKLLDAAYAMPEDPAARRELAELERRLAVARADDAAGNYEAAASELERLWPEAQALEHVPLIVAVARSRALVAERRANYEDAEAHHVEAYQRALGAGLTEDAAAAAISLVRLFGTLEGRHAEVEVWKTHAEPLAQAGSTPELRFTLAGALGLAAGNAGDYAEALEHHQAQLELLELQREPSALSRAATYTNLGIASARLSRFAEAREDFERALELGGLELGPNHPRVAAWLDNLGNTQRQLGEHEQALANYERALQIRERALGPDHPEVANTLTNLGLSLLNAEQPERARALQQRALDIYVGEFGPEHPRVAVALGNLGMALRDLGEHEQALEAFARALAIKRASYGDEHPSIAYSLNGLADAQLQLGRLEQARTTYTRSLELVEAKLGPEHMLAVPALVGLGSVERKLGELDAALAHYGRALKLAEQTVGKGQERNATLMTSLGGTLLLAGRVEPALRYFEDALQVREALFEAGDPKILRSRMFRACAWLRLERAAEARLELEGMLELLEPSERASPLLRAQLQLTLLAALRELGEGRSEAGSELQRRHEATRAELDDYERGELEHYASWLG